MSCQGVKDQFGLGKRSPDEFSVVTRAPLAIPPDFALRPPQPGISRPQESKPMLKAQAVLTSNVQEGTGNLSDSSSQNHSTGEQFLLDLAGTGSAKGNIREVINSENAVLANTEDSFVDQIMFWQQTKNLGAVIIDPELEAQRLQENASLGKLPTEGVTPVIERRRKAILEDLF